MTERQNQLPIWRMEGARHKNPKKTKRANDGGSTRLKNNGATRCARIRMYHIADLTHRAQLLYREFCTDFHRAKVKIVNRITADIICERVSACVRASRAVLNSFRM